LDAGHDAVHVIDVGLATATDPEIVDHAMRRCAHRMRLSSKSASIAANRK